MPKQLTHQLFTLIKSLSKAEKRNFSIYAKRNSVDKEMKFFVLFQALEGQLTYDEKKLLKKLTQTTKSQLSNLKSHLYDQILVSLRLLNRKDDDIKLYETIGFAKLLFKKGLYLQSLAQLAKAKDSALNLQQEIVLLEIIEFEKYIESNHITRSHASRSEELTIQASNTRHSIVTESEWSDFSIQLYGLYLKIGHVRNERDYEQVKYFFNSGLPKHTSPNTSFYAEVYRFQCYVWYNFILQKFDRCYYYSLKWVNLFDENPLFKAKETSLYLKGLHNVISALFYCYNGTRFTIYQNTLNNFVEENQSKFSLRTKSQAFLFTETAYLNGVFLRAEFENGKSHLNELELQIEDYSNYIDGHRKIILHYKMACVNFGAADFKGCIKYLNLIINTTTTNLKEDLQCFARILSLIAHYELGNNDLIDHQIRSTYRFLLNMKDMQMVQKEIINFLKNSVYMNRGDLTTEFTNLKGRLEKIYANKYERRPFLYLDLLSWLESKIEHVPVAQVVKRRLNNGKGYQF
jgi:hypothetical protein